MAIKKEEKTKKVVKKTKKTPKTRGNPTFKSEKNLIETFEKYIQVKGFVDKYQTFNGGQYGEGAVYTKAYSPISIAGFCNYLRTISKGISTVVLYDYLKKYPNAKKQIDFLIEEHVITGIANGDIAQSFGIFYLKNKCDYTDRIETINTNIEEKEQTKTMREIALEKLNEK